MSPKTKGSFLEGLGIDTSSAGVPFFRPTGKPQTVTITDIRPPTPDESPKDIPDKSNPGQMNSVPVLAVATVTLHDVEHVWEVMSRRALAALDDVITEMPTTVVVQTRGSGTNTLYSVQKPKLQAPTKDGKPPKYVDGKQVNA